jgi:predicted TIM-barrel fold metal-dependent hydrolase
MENPGLESNALSRRDALKTLAMTGTAIATLSSKHLFGQQVNKSTAKGGRIDVHHHHAPPALQVGPGRAGRAPWTPELSLQMMDKFDIAVSILSMTQMGDILYDGTERGRKAVRIGNDYGAKVMADHPKRFGLFTGVPLPDIDAVMTEIAYGLDTLKADGIGIYTNDNHNRWPGDPYFDPMWQELNRRNTIVYMHPLAPQCCRDLNDGVPTAMNEFDFDITRACTSILAGGVLHKYPNIKIIIPHSGGTMPVLAGRIKDRYPGDPKHAEYIPNGVYPELKKFYFDIAHASFPMPLAALLKFAPEDHILFGTDFSPEPIESTVNELPTSGLPPKLMAAIERGNTEKLFPRFKV